MLAKRFGVLSCALLCVGLMFGVFQAAAAGSTKVLKFYDAGSQESAIGFDASNPNAIPPIGGAFVITLRLQNIGSQFGKPSGATVGHVSLECTVLAVNMAAQSLDGVCSGIAHVPNGYFTFGGNGGLTDTHVSYFDITGGVGPYANDRGQIMVVNHKNGSSDATVTLYS